MSGELDLINGALSRLGEEQQLFDLDQDPPPRVLRVARGLLPMMRDSMIRKQPWLCCLRRRTLPRINTGSSDDWGYSSAFQLPPETLRIWAVNTSRPWTAGAAEERDGSGGLVAKRKAILAGGDGPLRAILIERVAYEDLDANLLDAMSAELASRMAGPLQADKALRKAMKDEAATAYAEAVTAETSEFGNEAPPFESAWLAARYGGDGWSYGFEGGSTSAGVL